MRSLCLLLALAACGDGSHAKPDAAGPSDVGADTGSNGTDVDLTFGSHGTASVIGGTCWAFAVDASDRPVLLQNTGSGDATVVRYDTSGQPDPSFTPHQLFTDAAALPKLFVLPSGKLLVTALDMTTGHVVAYRLTSDGTVDLDLPMPTKLGVVFGAGERSDGGIDLVGVGDMSTDAFTFARITAAGAVDTTFGTQGVAAPTTTNIPPGYFPHAVYLGNGAFALTGASFASTNAQGGTGPITGQLLIAADGVITSTATTDHTQYLDLVKNGDKLYALANSYPSNIGVIERFNDSNGASDSGFSSTGNTTFNPVYGLDNGGRLAVASGGGLIDTNGMVVNRFVPDGNMRPTSATVSAPVCGLAFDSHDRAFVASSTTVVRLVQ